MAPHVGLCCGLENVCTVSLASSLWHRTSAQAGGITTAYTGYSAVIIYPNFGLSVAFDRLWGGP